MHDLVIRGGTVADGTGRAPREADVAIDDGRIAAVGKSAERGREELDATGRLVTPGGPDDATLARDLADAIEEQRACWLARSRPGGLADSVAQLESTLAGYASTG